MRKKLFGYLFCLLLIFVMGCAYLFNFNKKDNSIKKITLAEVAHTIFYAPMYVAIEKDYFKDYNIDLDLVLANGADKVTAAILGGDADIAFCGSEATIYVYNGGEKDYLKTFAQLTQKDGTFLVSREKIDDFTLDKLKGKTIIGGRSGGMPEMTLEYALKKNGLDPKKDLNIDTSIAFAAMSGAFIGGEGDFVTLFEPTATMVEKEGYGYIVSSIGDLAGNVPYTSFSARDSFIKENKKVIKDFTTAIQKGLDYVHSHSDEEIAEAIKGQFPDTKKEDLINAIKNYRSAWPTTTNFSKESFDHLQDIMIDYGEIKKKVSYDKLTYKIK